MALQSDHHEKVDRLLTSEPNVTIFLQPIAAPAALGLAGFAGSTWITASYIAHWWGNESSPTIFFPFVAFWGGLGQFIAGLYGFAARDVLVTVIHVLWGSFWMSIGLLYLLVVSLAFSLSFEDRDGHREGMEWLTRSSPNVGYGRDRAPWDP
jgi:succinate-acetate transporter protein